MRSLARTRRTASAAELAASPARRAPGRRRRSAAKATLPVRSLALILAVVVVAAILPAAGYLYAAGLEAGVAGEFKAGQAAMESGKADLKAATAAHDQAALDRADADFGRARDHFAAAGREVAAVPGAAASVPYAGPRIRAVSSLARMGMALADAGRTAVKVDALLVEPSSAGQSGAHLLDVLNGAEAALPALNRQVGEAHAAAAEVDPGVLPTAERASLAKAKDSIDKAAAAIADLTPMIPALREILGGNGPRSYLIAQLNPAELRSGGGFLGTYSVLGASGGVLKISGGGELSVGGADWPRPTKGKPGYVAPPDALANSVPTFYRDHLSWSLEDSNYYPDFATNAQKAESFAQSSLHLQTDGVVAVDFAALGAMLTLSGPVTVPGFGVVLDSGNFNAEVIDRSLERDPSRKGFVSAAAGPILSKLVALDPGKWPQLLSLLNDAVAQGHIQVYFNDATAQKLMAKFGWSRGLDPAHATDFLMETEDNYGGNKVNYAIRRSYSITLTRTPAGVHHQVEVTLEDKAAPKATYGDDYFCLIRFYVPAGASNLKNVTSQPSRDYKPIGPIALSDAPPGMAARGGWFFMTAGPRLSNVYRVDLQYDTPWNPDRSGDQVLYWQKQPGTGGDAFQVTWLDQGRTWSMSGQLTQDVVLTLGSGGLRVAAAAAPGAQLPALGL